MPGRDGGPRGGVGDAVWWQAREFEEHLFQAAGDHEGEELAAPGTGGDRVPDPAYVLWATTKLVDAAKLPDRTVIVRFELRDRPGKSYWLLLRKPTPELCTKGAGYVEDIIVRGDAACLIDIHLKRTSYQEALRSGRLCLEGPRQLTEGFLTWVRPSPYADIVPARLGQAGGGVPR